MLFKVHQMQSTGNGAENETDEGFVVGSGFSTDELDEMIEKAHEANSVIKNQLNAVKYPIDVSVDKVKVGER